MDILSAAILGVVEGITEFLPISSTGHLILASRLLGLEQTEFLKSFEIAIQLGAILSVIALYGRRFLLNRAILLRLAAAFVPTAVIGLVLYKLIKHFFLGNQYVVLWALFAGGILLILFEKWHKEESGAMDQLEKIPIGKAVAIGAFQSLAVIPGVSRAAATIIGGLLLGLTRRTIVEFSFLLAMPTMLAATVLDLLKSGGGFSGGQYGYLAVGFSTSFVVAIAGIKFLLAFIKNNNFVAFGVYRIVVSVFFYFWLLR